VSVHRVNPGFTQRMATITRVLPVPGGPCIKGKVQSESQSYMLNRYSDPSAPQAASDFDPTSDADFGAATRPGVGGGTHRRRATFDRG